MSERYATDGRAAAERTKPGLTRLAVLNRGLGDARFRLVARRPPGRPTGAAIAYRPHPTRRSRADGSADAAPQWSPDGRWIAYLSDAQEPNPAESDIWIISADPPFGEKYNLTGATEGQPSNGNNWSPAWLPQPREAARGG